MDWTLEAKAVGYGLSPLLRVCVCVDLCYQEDTEFLQQPSTSADRTCENFEHVLLHSCRGQRVSFHGLCQRSSVKLGQVNVPAVVGMGTLVQLVTTTRHVVEPERVPLMHMSVTLLSNCL